MLVRIIFLFLFALFSTVSTVNADSVKSEEGQIEKEITKYIIEMEKVCNTAENLESAGWTSMEIMYKLVEIGTPTVPKLIKAFEDKTKDWKFRWFIGAEVLGGLKDTRAVDPLIKALKDENKEIRKAGINALGDIKDNRAVEPLIEALKDENKDVRMFIPASLSAIGDNKAVEPLIEILKDKYWYVRINTARALGNLGDERAVQPLIEALKNENETVQVKSEDSPSLERENEVVRMIIVEALGKLKDRVSIEPLIDTMKNDKSDHVRITATKALVELSKIQSPIKKDKESKIRTLRAKPVADPRIVDSLIEALESEDELLQMYAAKSLMEIGAKKAEEPIKKAISKVKDKYVKENMEKILKELTQQ